MTTPSEPTPDTPPEAPPKAGRRRSWKFYFRVAVLTPLFLFVLYTIVVYNWSYSDGDRSGILRKFSRKGWLCKTWEGELAMTTVPGVMPELWAFTVRNDSVISAINGALGKQVVLHYGEHRGLWTSCFGETRYFVDSVRVIQ